MAARRRAETMEENRLKLIGAARKAFAASGFADASMDDLTAQVGLTRGALYHGFGDKKGLLAAVVAQVDGEMAARAHQAGTTTARPLGKAAGGRRSLYRDGARPRGPTDCPVGRACLPRLPVEVAQSECLPDRHEAGGI